MTPTLAIAPLVWAVAQALKKAGIPGRFIPLVAAFLGLGAGIALNGQTVYAALEGVAAGLAAVGLYEAGKRTLG